MCLINVLILRLVNAFSSAIDKDIAFRGVPARLAGWLADCWSWPVSSLRFVVLSKPPRLKKECAPYFLKLRRTRMCFRDVYRDETRRIRQKWVSGRFAELIRFGLTGSCAFFNVEFSFSGQRERRLENAGATRTNVMQVSALRTSGRSAKKIFPCWSLRSIIVLSNHMVNLTVLASWKGAHERLFQFFQASRTRYWTFSQAHVPPYSFIITY